MIMAGRCSFRRSATFRSFLQRAGRSGSNIFIAWLQFVAGLSVGLALSHPASAAVLSDPEVDAYNVRVGTETFAGMYQFTTNTLLVETAEAITNLCSDSIKFYLASDTSFQEGVELTPNITNLVTLARDEPSYHKVFDMPFRRFIVWAYPLANSAEWWGSGYNATKGAVDYKEMYDLTHYLLTNYNNSGKTFYLGHWEGDGYLKVNNWTTNPSATTIQGMIGWLNNRQKAVDDAKAATTYANVQVYNYAECNRVRDAMLKGPTNNCRVVNMVLPYITNLDYLSYSSYDAQNLSAADLYTTLDYIQSMLPTNKAPVVPGERIWIGEYGHGGYTTAAQEPLNRSYIQRLLNWNHGGQCLPFILFWEMYANYNAGGKTNGCLVDYQDNKAPSWYLHNYFINDARMLVARFKESHGRLPDDTEFSSFMSPCLDQALPAPVNLAITNGTATLISNATAVVSGTLTQGVYRDDEAGVWVFYGRQDGGAVPGNWEGSRFIGVNTNFSPRTFTAVLSNLVAQTNYYFRFYTTNASGSIWAPASSQFSTATLNPADYGSRLKITISGYNRDESLSNFPELVQLSPGRPGFSYHQFASDKGGDLRFTDAGGVQLIPHEVDEWNTNGVSMVWVRVPSLSPTNNWIWAYWGNPAETNPPVWTTNGSVWTPTHELAWHLKESGFPYADSTLKHPAVSGTLPASTAGIVGRGISLNGSSQFLNAGTIDLGNSFTLSAWINVSSTASDEQVIWANKTSGWNANGFALFVNSYQTTDGTLNLATGNGTGGSTAVTGSGVITPGVWHQVAAVVDEAGGAARLYVDGVDRTKTSSIQTDFQNDAPITMGRMTNGSFSFEGAIDEARIAPGMSSSNWVWASWANITSNAGWEDSSAVIQQIPSLSVGIAGDNNLLFSWPGFGTAFALFSATNLAASAVWDPVTNGLIFTNNHWQTTLSPSDSVMRLFRLQAF
jgi:hypothetical protein